MFDIKKHYLIDGLKFLQRLKIPLIIYNHKYIFIIKNVFWLFSHIFCKQICNILTITTVAQFLIHHKLERVASLVTDPP